MVSILVIDNYDSFTYNLVGALELLGASCEVVSSDRVSFEAVRKTDRQAILLSPGPCAPRDAGVCLEVVRRADGRHPILGVCLGHQVIGEAFGASVTRAPPVHGRVSPIEHDGRTIFRGVRTPFEAMRYHSLSVSETSLPSELEVSARSDGLVMAMRHRSLPIEGVQFHPESWLTVDGPELLSNWLQGVERHWANGSVALP